MPTAKAVKGCLRARRWPESPLAGARRWKWGADGGGAGRWGERDREATPGGGDNGAEGATVNRPAIQDLVLEQDKVSEKSVLSMSYTFIYRSLL